MFFLSLWYKERQVGAVMFPIRMYKESFIHIVSEGDWYVPFEMDRSNLPIPYKILWIEA